MNNKKKTTSGIFIMAISILLIFIVGGFILFNRGNRVQNPIPANITQGLDFPVFYPAAKDISVDSVKLVDGSVSYIARYKDTAVFVSVQPKPGQLNIDNLVRQVTDQTTYRSPLGKVLEGKLSGRLIGSLMTDKTWLFLSASPDTPKTDLDYLLEHLKRA